jgi:hypothetical protein
MAQILGTGYQRAAKLSRVLVNTTPLTFASWEAVLNGDDLNTTNFESYYTPTTNSSPNTFDEGILGVIGADLRFGGDWDAHFVPVGNPPGLYPRDDLTNLQFYTARVPGTQAPEAAWAFGYARLRSATNGGTVKDKVTFQCSGKNQGYFAYPASSV